VTLDRSVWGGYIKDYDGGTLMHCEVDPKINYLDAPMMVKNQRECVYNKLKEFSNSHLIYSGIKAFKNGADRINVENLPGLKECGWDPKYYHELLSEKNQAELLKQNRELLEAIKAHEKSWPFKEPVNTSEVPDYLEVIKDPIDLSAIEKKLNAGNYYITREMFIADLQRMCDNCKTYNKEGTIWHVCAIKIENRFLKRYKPKHFVSK